jgi:lipopolysaccharide/colanic/teichoic acid biosynthesis glycosyltransferase
MKRAFDVVVSLVALVVLSPLLAAAAIAILLESGRPVFFKQTRLGLGGREFKMYKFRSMVKDAALIGPWHTIGDDPRITRVGRFLRRTSIDELPQLLNVVVGDMSIVGPRPDVPAQRSAMQTGRCVAAFAPASPAWLKRCFDPAEPNSSAWISICVTSARPPFGST